jgi:HTH-type transcriptional regulator / antitoxin HigA
METKEILYSDLPVPPGEYLEEVIDELGMSKDELAKRMNRPAPKLSAIFKGEKAITPDTALQLEKVVGVPAHIWTGLEAEYRLTLARQQEIKERQRLKDESSLVTNFRYADLVKLNVVQKKTLAIDKVLELHKFFGVTSLMNLSSIRRYQPIFRLAKKNKGKESSKAITSWLRIGEIRAQKQILPPFDKDKLKQTIQDIRGLSRLNPESFQDELHKKLADAGVSLIICPHLPGTNVHGATFWLGKEKAVIMMTIRGKWADIFWFSLFHELGHILLHDRNSIFLETDNEEYSLNENEADQYASDVLIPPSDYARFIEKGNFYKDRIVHFADEIQISPGIVVGRLQHDGHIKNEWHNDLRTRYDWEK